MRTVADYLAATTVSVNQTTATPVHALAADHNAVQVYIRPSSTEQIFTVNLPSGGSIEVHSGSVFHFSSRRAFQQGEELFSVITATSGAVLQVIGFRE